MFGCKVCVCVFKDVQMQANARMAEVSGEKTRTKARELQRSSGMAKAKQPIRRGVSEACDSECQVTHVLRAPNTPCHPVHRRETRCMPCVGVSVW